MRLKVFQHGIKAMDELTSTVLHLKLAAIPRTPETYYSESSTCANLYRLPWHSSDWKESLKIATPNQVRHYHRCFIAELRESLHLMARIESSDEARALETRNVLDLLVKGTSLSRFVLKFNPLALLTNIGRNLETGTFNDQDEQFSRSLALFALNFFSPASIEKLRGGIKLFHEQLGKIQTEKALLSNLLNYHLKSGSDSASSNKPDSLFYLCDLAKLPRETQSFLLGQQWPTMHQLILSDTFLSSLPSSPMNPPDDTLAKLIEEVNIYRGSTSIIKNLLTCIQKTVNSETAARSLLVQVASEAVSPIVNANIQVRSYPYLVNVPKLLQDCLSLHDALPPRCM